MTTQVTSPRKTEASPKPFRTVLGPVGKTTKSRARIREAVRAAIRERTTSTAARSASKPLAKR